jgi:sec-independent protein translocase protein TatC
MSLLKGLFNFRALADDEAVKPFLSHLEDLRWMLVKMALTIVAGVVVTFSFHTQLLIFLQRPLHEIAPDIASNLQVLGIMDVFSIILKLSFYAGIVLTFPILLFYIAQFVMPALTKREKKIVFPIIAVGFFLFLAGVCFAYYFILPKTLAFFFQLSKDNGFRTIPTATNYFSFVAQMCLALGAAFEMPVVIFALNFLGVLSHDLMRRTRVFAIPLLLVLATVIAPTPDPFTMLSIAVPMYCIYELSIWITWFTDRRRNG